MKCSIVVGFLVSCLVNFVVSSEKIVVCYYGTWATYRWGLGKFDVEDINADLCTHLIYTFVGLNTDGTVAILDPYLDLADNWGRGNFKKFVSLKQKNASLKTLLAIGGWNEGSAKYSIMAASASLRTTFVASVTSLLLEHSFDGLDVDWEYPNRRDTVNGQADIDNLTKLLKELRESFDKHGLSLSIATSSVKSMASLSYDIPAVSAIVDFVCLMTYDMYGAWDTVTGHNAGLHMSEADAGRPKEDLMTVDVALEYWIAAGCPPEKLILGLPFYGRTFTLVNAANSDTRAPSSGAGIAGPFTATNGIIGYNEFCALTQTETWDIRYDSDAKVPYGVRNNNWVSFDNADSLAAKIEYGLSLGIGGAMVWSIETDDFHGLCHGEDFPLLRAINRALGRSVGGDTSTQGTTTTSTTSTGTITTQSPTSNPSPTPESSSEPSELPLTSLKPSTTTSTTQSSTSSPSPTTLNPSTTTEQSPSSSTTTPSSLFCKEEGVTSDPEDCTRFYYCVRNGDGVLDSIPFQCPGNLLWDQVLVACNYPQYVEC